VATTKQIYKMFYPSLRTAQADLSKLNKNGFIKQTRSTIDNCFAYYISQKPVQIHHDLIRTELFINLRDKYQIVDWKNELPIFNIRPDATVHFKNTYFSYINDNDIIFPLFIEIHLNNKFNFTKYQELVKNNDFKLLFKYAPRVLICTDRELKVPQNIGIRFRIVNYETMQGLDSIFL
jgi:hypothetical protein